MNNRRWHFPVIPWQAKLIIERHWRSDPITITILSGLSMAAATAAAGVGVAELATKGTLFNKPKTPGQPALPPAPKVEDATATALSAALAQRRQSAAATGGSILTSPIGDVTAPPTQVKTLLGS